MAPVNRKIAAARSMTAVRYRKLVMPRRKMVTGHRKIAVEHRYLAMLLP